MRKYIKSSLLVFVTLAVLIANCSFALAAGTTKTISVSVNAVTVNFDGKATKIDNFSLSGKVFVQPQDVSSRLNIGYTYDAKTKTINISSKKPAKPVAPAGAKFSSVKPGTVKKLTVQTNAVTLKIDGKPVKSDNYTYNGAFYASAKDMADLLKKNYILNTAAKTLSISSKAVQPPSKEPDTPPAQVEEKPSTPVLTADVTQNTKGKVTVTISNWGNALTKEYSLDDGATWKAYSAPVVLSENATVSARGKTASGLASDTGVLKVGNILKLLNKTEVSEKRNTVVKVIAYDINHEELGSGSGFVISSDGKVVTNYHVVDMVPIIEVQTSDNVKLETSGILNYSVEKDIAIIQIKDVNSLPYATLGDSSELKVGEDVVAMGHPLGLGLTVTFGTVSGLDTPGGSTRKNYKDIQFTAAVSPGNSGGPLMNMYGEVVGINYSLIVGGQNLNYSIPINDLKPMLEGLGSVKKYVDVIKEVYPDMDYKELSYYLFCNYPAFEAGGHKFTFTDINVQEYSEDPNELDVYVDLDSEKIAAVLSALSSGDTDSVKKWLSDIYSTVKAYYGDKKVYVLLAYFDFFDQKPSQFDDKYIQYDSSIQEWIVYIPACIFSVENGNPEMVFNPAILLYKNAIP